ncbi:g13474 [Coccomyxa viridis]|uniref:G13474 protein n=1 Tax=Coccomyxa viridis TaxID=1274662 RepID=A0ABP1GCV3_9CHLO
MQAQQVLRQRFPGMEVVPSTYPVSAQRAALARVVMGLQFGGIAVVLGGDRIFPALGMEMPQVLAQMREKKMGVVMGIWLLGNALQNQLSATGAFEVYFDGKQMHSKLETGRVPSMDELVSSIELAMGA